MHNLCVKPSTLFTCSPKACATTMSLDRAIASATVYSSPGTSFTWMSMMWGAPNRCACLPKYAASSCGPLPSPGGGSSLPSPRLSRTTKIVVAMIARSKSVAAEQFPV